MYSIDKYLGSTLCGRAILVYDCYKIDANKIIMRGPESQTMQVKNAEGKKLWWGST